MYAELEHGVGYLEQLGNLDPSASELEVFVQCLERTSAMLNGELDIHTELTAAAATTQTVYGSGTQRLFLPPHTHGSVTAVTAPTGYTVPDYIQRGGVLVATSPDGILSRRVPATYFPFSTYAGVWEEGVPFTVAASFGYSATIMKILEQACLEGAVALWRYKDAGGSQELGEGDAVVVVRDAWSPKIARQLTWVRRQIHGTEVVF